MQSKQISLVLILLLITLVFLAGCTELGTVTDCGDGYCTAEEEYFCEADCGELRSQIVNQVIDEIERITEKDIEELIQRATEIEESIAKEGKEIVSTKGNNVFVANEIVFEKSSPSCPCDTDPNQINCSPVFESNFEGDECYDNFTFDGQEQAQKFAIANTTNTAPKVYTKENELSPLTSNFTLNFSAPVQKPELTNNVIIIYNENDTEALEIAQYYATQRGIDEDQICAIQTPTVQFALAKHVLSSRKKILECMCNIINEQNPNTIRDCTYEKYKEIALNSQITHMAIIKGIPPRMNGTGWPSDNERPSFDFYLATNIYRDGNIFYPGSTGLDTYYPYKGSFEFNRYRTRIPEEIDFQTRNPTKGYARSIDANFDKILAYGRIEAITTERTFELIDRTLAAEQAGFSGNVLTQADYTENWPDSYGYAQIDFLRDLTADHAEECISYLKPPFTIWPYQNCRFGATEDSDTPGEEANTITIPRAINTGMYLGGDPWGSGQRSFENFWTMINWHKTETNCTELCEQFQTQAERDTCITNSTDYLKEINTDCVGGALGLIGHQVRSYPVEYYGFYPAGIGAISGGIFDKSPVVVLEDSTAYKDENFTDDKYLHIGSDTTKENPTCELEDGTSEACDERIGISFSVYFHPNAEKLLTPQTDETYTLKIRMRGEPNSVAVQRLRTYMKFTFTSKVIATDDGSRRWNYSIPKMFSPLSLSDTWQEFELDFDFNNSRVADENKDDDIGISYARVWLWAQTYDNLKNSVDIDGMEILNSKGERMTIINIGSFNTHYKQTVNGNYASDAIDRLGAIGWWGSSSHHLTGGWAFSGDQKFAGAFFSGRSLGESLAHISWNGKSGIIYGDPLYNPSGAKLFVGDGLNLANSKEDRFYFSDHINQNQKIKINAFHGTNNLATTNWKLSVCYDENQQECNSNNSWTESLTGTSAVFEQQLNKNLMSFVTATEVDQNFMLWLEVWNPGEEQEALSSYGYFSYQVPECGNERVEVGEECDTLEFAGGTCLNNGYAGGNLSCTASCTLDKTTCIDPGCGNGVWESGLGEYCDTDAITFYYESCVQSGYCGGEIQCNNTCTDMNLLSCFDYSDPQCDASIKLKYELKAEEKYYLSLPIHPFRRDLRDIFVGAPLNTSIQLKHGANWRSTSSRSTPDVNLFYRFGRGGDIIIEPGMSIYIKPTADYNVTIWGEPVTSPAKILVQGEYPLIGVPFCNEAYNSQTMIEEINSIDTNCHQIKNIPQNMLEQKAYSLIDNNKDIFPIDNNLVYLIYCDVTTDFNWTPNCHIQCNTNADCGEDFFVGDRNCQGNRVVSDKSIWTCTDPGTTDSTCMVTISQDVPLANCAPLRCTSGACEHSPRETHKTIIRRANQNDLNILVNGTVFNSHYFSDNRQVKIKRGIKPIVEFDFEFTNDLNLVDTNLVSGEVNGNDYLIVKDLNIGTTKTVYIDRNGGNEVCILDENNVNLSDLESTCVRIACPGYLGNIDCTIDGNYYKVSGLEHSGIIADYEYCGDDYCSPDESTGNCPDDCDSAPDDPPVDPLIPPAPPGSGGDDPPADITCVTTNDCGSPRYTGSNYCGTNKVVRKYETWSCTDANTIDSACVKNEIEKTITNCRTNETCTNAVCVVPTICANGFTQQGDSCICTGTPCDGTCYTAQGVCCDGEYKLGETNCTTDVDVNQPIFPGLDFPTLESIFNFEGGEITEENLMLVGSISAIIIIIIIIIFAGLHFKKKPREPQSQMGSKSDNKDALLEQLRENAKR